jgi:hypothetical protein
VGFTATKLYGATYHIQTGSSWFSKVTPRLWYTLTNVAGHPTIYAYDFTSTTTAPTLGNGGITQVVDLATAPNCLGANFGMKYNGEMTVSDDDQTFAVSLSNTGYGDTALYATVWNRTNGCRVLNSGTATVSGNWGTLGTLDDTVSNGGPATCKLHETILSHDGNTLDMICALGGCTSSSCGLWGLFYWTVSGLHAIPVTNADACGHRTMGYTHAVNKCIIATGNAGPMTFFARDLSNPNPSPYAVMLNPNFLRQGAQSDQHDNWNNNVDGTDTALVTTTTYNGSNTVVNVWDTEILAVRTDCYPSNCAGVMPYRVAHTYSDGTDTADFQAQYAIGTLSAFPANGAYYYLYGSNWERQLGCDDGVSYSPCPQGHKPRSDAFIVRIPVSQ